MSDYQEWTFEQIVTMYKNDELVRGILGDCEVLTGQA